MGNVSYLFVVLVENGGVLVGASGQDLARVVGVDVHGQDAGHAGGVESGMGGEGLEAPDVVRGNQLLGDGLAALLPLPGQDLGLVLQLVHDLRSHARGLGRGRSGRSRLGGLLAYRGLSGGVGRRHKRCLRLERGQGLPGRGDLLVEPGDDAAGGVVLVERVTELLAGGLQLLPEGEGVQHHGVPLILQRLEDGRDGGGRGRLRLDEWRGLEGDELLHAERLLVDGVGAVLGDVLLDETLLEDLARDGRDHRGLGRLE